MAGSKLTGCQDNAEHVCRLLRDKIKLAKLAGSIPMIYSLQINTLPDDKILDWSKLKETADNIFKVHLK